MKTRVQAKIVGRVQGVGFRPTVYRYATERGLTGYVRNDPAGVTLEIEGEAGQVESFLRQLRSDPPRQAVITGIETREMAVQHDRTFSVADSKPTGSAETHISPDLATCDDCLCELNDPQDRRYGYPFINCTNCGPRFTILRDLPYDRANTSMDGFKMCAPCDYEYNEPCDRRFHAQPDACAECGPRLEFCSRESHSRQEAGRKEASRLQIDRAVELLRTGQIVAIKSLGGFHLACTLDAAVQLRARKYRPHKPFAVMFRNVEAVKRHCKISEAEEAELLSVARPIVILKSRKSPVSPDFPSMGAFLPYTPLHHLLMAHFDALVMTSGNLAEEPIASDEAELPAVADAVLTHNRPIVHKCDDSVVRIVNGQRQFFRRARGFAPNAIRFTDDSPHILAVGGELKNTFCLARDGWAFLSQHIGDLKEYKTHKYFTHEIAEWQRLMRVAPVAVVHDLHPGYLSTRWAEKTGIRTIGVQHHHAHIASVMAEHNLHGEVIGVALDGTGYGPDGTVWGGEFLVATRADFERVAHFKQYRLPGGERAIEQPWRMALSASLAEALPVDAFTIVNTGVYNCKQPVLTAVEAVRRMVATGFNAPMTSSAGRLFDAVAAMLGLCDVASYEAQAAIRLEAAADASVTGHYPFDLRDGILDFGRTVHGVLADRQNVGLAAARFHNTVVAGIVKVCETIRTERGLKRVALSGGVFQNEWILTRTIMALRERGFEVFANSLVPPNDGGLSLGQAAVAAARLAGRAGCPQLAAGQNEIGAVEAPRPITAEISPCA